MIRLAEILHTHWDDYVHQGGRYIPVATDKAEAVFADGVLTLTLPKAEQARSNQIPIKVKK